MELTGRTYIFAAATLILLAGALSFYQQNVDAGGGQLALFGAAEKACQSESVRTSNVRIGCTKDLNPAAGGGQVTSLAGGAKMVRVGS